MCVINMNLTTSTQQGTTITSANGRYRLQGSNTWNNFSINLLDPKTPNITQIGQYDLEVNVSNSAGATSEWVPSTFIVSEKCLTLTTNPELNTCKRFSVTFIEDLNAEVLTTADGCVGFTYTDCKTDVISSQIFCILGESKQVCSTDSLKTLQVNNPSFSISEVGAC